MIQSKARIGRPYDRGGVGIPDSPAHQAVADRKKAAHAQDVGEEIHGHGVGGVLCPPESRFHQTESRLHQHDDGGGKRHPGEVLLHWARGRSRRNE